MIGHVVPSIKKAASRGFFIGWLRLSASFHLYQWFIHHRASGALATPGRMWCGRRFLNNNRGCGHHRFDLLQHGFTRGRRRWAPTTTWALPTCTFSAIAAQHNTLGFNLLQVFFASQTCRQYSLWRVRGRRAGFQCQRMLRRHRRRNPLRCHNGRHCYWLCG